MTTSTEKKMLREMKNAAGKLAYFRLQVATHERANKSERRARGRYGDKAVDAAIAAAIKAKRNKKFFDHERPYPTLMKWYRSLK